MSSGELVLPGLSLFGYGTQIMNGVLIPDVSTSPAFTELAGWAADGLRRRLAVLEQTIGGLRDEVAELRQENAELRRENAELKQEAGYWKAMHARAVEREAKLAEELETARGEIRKLQDRLFGRKSERDSRGTVRTNCRIRKSGMRVRLRGAAHNSPAAGVPAVATTPICRRWKSASSCRKTSNAARRAAGRGGREPIRKTRNRSRSKCELIAA